MKSRVMPSALVLAVSAMTNIAVFAGSAWTQTATDVLKAELAKETPSPTIVTQEGTWSFVSPGGTLTAEKDWTGPGGNRPKCDALKNPDNTRPYFAVNTKGAATGPDGGTFDEDVICLHPYYGRTTLAVRFQPSVCGTYGLSLYGEGVSLDGDGVAYTIKLNGVAISDTMTICKPDVESGTLETQGLTLTPADVVEVFIDSLGSVGSDGQKMKFSVSRTGDYTAATWATTLAEDFAYAYTRTIQSSACASTRKGTWSFGTLSGSTFTAFPAVVTSKSGYANGVGFGASASGYPFALYNAGTASVNWKNDTVAPGALVAHPDGIPQCAFKYVVEDSGVYSVRTTVTDIETSYSAEATSGVNFNFYKGGLRLGTVHVDRAFGNASDSLVFDELMLKSGDELLFSVDSNGQRSGDATKLDLTIAKTGAIDTCHDFTSAYRANMVSASPTAEGFTDADGGTWSVGSWSLMDGVPAFGQFVTFDQRHTDASYANMTGWTKSGSNYAYVDVNSAVEASNSRDCGTVQASEVAIHTSKSTASGIRFIASADGVYFLSGYVKNNRSGGDGVDVHVIVRDAVRPICVPVGNNEVALLSYRDVWLARGETIDVVFDALDNQESDGRVANVVVAKTGAQKGDMTRINVDIGNGSVYAGRGRIGNGDDTWTKLSCGTGVGQRENLATNHKSMYTSVSLEIGASASGAGEAAGVPNALLADGAASSGTTDVRSFTLRGLQPNATHALYLYSSGEAPMRFTVGTTTKDASEGCFTLNPESAKIVALSDENGVVSGTFCSSVDGVTALFAGIQIEADAFPERVKPGFVLVVR